MNGDTTGYLHGGKIQILDTDLTAFTKSNSNMDQDFHIKYKMAQILEDKRGESLGYLGFCEDFYTHN